MAKVKKRNPVTQRKLSQLDPDDLLALAAKRVDLPEVPMVFDYQDDVDTLCIHFEGNVSPILVDDDFENGVIGIYKGKELIGIEILDISGQLEHANPK